MKRFFLFGIALLASGLCLAQPRDEVLVMKLPPGYTLDYQTRQGNMALSEWVPQGESVNNWSEMVTLMHFNGLKDVPPERFQAVLGKPWLEGCRGSQLSPVTQGREFGYPFSIWVQSCPSSPLTGKLEKTWFKAIQGNVHAYVIQKSFKFEPSEQQVAQWLAFFRTVVVCDSQTPGPQCPKPR